MRWPAGSRAWGRQALWWLLLWLGFGLLLTVAIPPSDAGLRLEVWGLVGAGIAGGVVLRLPRPWLVAAFLSALAVGLAVSVFHQWLSLSSLSGAPERVRTVAVSLSGATSLLEGPVGAFRAWRSPGPSQTVELRLQARLAGAAPNDAPGWQPRSGDSMAIDAAAAPGSPTRFSAEVGSQGVATRLLTTERPLAGRTFRARFEARGDLAPGLDRPLLTLSDQRGQHKGNLDLRVSSDWQGFEIVWRAPDAVVTHALVLTLSRLNGHRLELAGLEVQELEAGGWRPLDGGPHLLVQLGASEAALGELSTDWQGYTVLAQGTEAEALEARFTVGSGASVLMRDVTARVLATGAGLQSVPASDRVRFLGLHPNIIGHGAAAAFLVVLSSAAGLPTVLLAVVPAAVIVWLVGSRAALAGILLGLTMVLLGRRGLLRHRAWLLLALPLTLAFGYLAWGTGSWDRGSPGSTAGRLEVWSVALAALSEHPRHGLPGSFGEHWQEQRGGQAPVTHAHNLWLQFGANHGLPGLLAILWFTVGLLLLAWRLGRWRGLTLVVPLLFMNLFDYTLFDLGVVIPIILGLNALGRSEGSVPPGEEPGAMGRRRSVAGRNGEVV